MITIYHKILAVLVSFVIFTSSASATNVWFSTTGSIVEGSSPPTLAQVANVQASSTGAGGSLYIWARPDAGQTLKNWSLLLHSTNPAVLNFTTTDIHSYNPTFGTTAPPNPQPIKRWANVSEPANGFPAGNLDDEQPLQGYTIFSNQGRGIGPTTTGTDPYYNASKNAWLLAKIDYVPTGVLGQTSLFLQIGSNGFSNLGQTSSQTSVVFGATSDAALNARNARHTNSATADAVMNVVAEVPLAGDFDDDEDVDGRDFLMWQRNTSVGSLANWQAGYDDFDNLSGFNSIPEPSAVVILFLVAGPWMHCRRRVVGF